MWRSDKTKEEGFRLLEVADHEKLNTCGKVIKDKGYFSEDCYVFFLCSGLISVGSPDEFFSFLVQERGTFPNYVLH